MKKKWIFLLLAVVLVFHFYHSGHSKSKKDDDSKITIEDIYASEAQDEKATSSAVPQTSAVTSPQTPSSSSDNSNVSTSNSTAAFSQVTALSLNGENIIDMASSDMTQNDYISDVYISADEAKKQINIVVQVPSYVTVDTAKMAGEDVARYLAMLATSTDSSYSSPGSDDLGGLYDQYDLLIYVDDGNKTFDLYGGKVTSSTTITW